MIQNFCRWVWVLLLAAGALADEPTAQVRMLTGKAWKTHALQRTALVVGATLSHGDEIETEGGAFAIVSIPGRVAFRVYEKSRARLITRAGDPFGLELVMGRVLNRIQKGPYNVRMSAVSLGVRGTTFMAQVEREKADLFCLCEGSLVVSPRSGGASVSMTRTARHQPMSVGAGREALRDRIHPVSLKGDEHTDLEIRELNGYL